MEIRAFAKRAAHGFVAIAAAVASCGASANTVTQWSFEVNSGFSAFAPAGTPPNGVVGSANNVALGLPTLLSWGNNPSPQSSLGVGATLPSPGKFTGSLTTGGAAVNTVTVTHTNNVINATSLTSATLTDTIFLTPTSPAGPGFAAPTLLFSINFLETPNVAGTCVVPSPVGNPCNDIFVIDVPGAGFNPVDNTLNQTFIYNAEAYNAILAINGLGVLSNAACAAVFGNNLHNGCIGFTTIENQVNNFQVSLRITDTPFVVPEPASLGLFGLALAGLGLRRRKVAKA